MIQLSRDKDTGALVVRDDAGRLVEDERYAAFLHADNYGGAYLDALEPSERLAVEAFQKAELFAAWREAQTEQFHAKVNKSPIERLVEDILESEYDGDRSKYAEAFAAAGERDPEAARQYVMRTRKGGA